MLKRQVEITAPPNKKEVANALNSGADAYMADFEDALSPTWQNVIDGHYYLTSAIKANLKFYDPARLKEYKVAEITQEVFIRPRSISRDEAHMLIDGKPISATIFDIVVYAFSNAKILFEKYKQSCYFYLPKI